MSSAKKCDICGILYERDYVPDLQVHKYCHGYGYSILDICDHCQKQLEEFVYHPITIANESNRKYNNEKSK